MESMFDAVRVLENSHSISIMLYIYRNDGCTKGDIYEDVCRYSRMTDKISDLEEAGLIRIEPQGRAVRLYLTDVGKEVGSLLSTIADKMCPA